jgi:hypothetical protein
MMIPRDQTVSSWYTGHFLRLYTVGRILPIVGRYQV